LLTIDIHIHIDDGGLWLKHVIKRRKKVKIAALRTEYIRRERHINATGCLNIIQ
jgi:pyruvate kinase